ncbi:hypothetical protein CsatA_005453 [Cannabis sativa]
MHRDSVFNRLRYYYDIDNNEHSEIITNIACAEIADIYKKRKLLRHVHFKKHYKSLADFDNVVAHPPSDLTPEEWLPICEIFTSPEFIAHYKMNTENKKMMQYPTTQGSKSMAKRRFEKGELVSAYEKQANTPDAGLVEEIEMSAHNEVFGERHNHNRGVGRKLKGKSSSRRTQLTPTQDMPMDPRVERQFEKLTRTMLWMSQRLGPDVRLPTEEELFGMPMPPTQTFQPQMSGGGFASSSQPGNFQYHQAQQCPIPFMYPLSSPQQMSHFPWLSSPMSQLQVNYMQQTPEMHQTQQMQQQPLQMYQQPFMQQTPQMQHTPQIQQQPSMQHTPQMPQQPPMQHTPQMQQQTPQMHQMHLMQQMPHLQQMPSMQQTPHMQQMPSMPSMHHMPPAS